MNDELAWVLQAQQGNDEAFTKLVEEHQTHVYNLCYRMLGEPEAAEDAAQETFLRAYQNLHRYDQTRSFATWLLSIGAHYCIDRLRRRKLSCSRWMRRTTTAQPLRYGMPLPRPGSGIRQARRPRPPPYSAEGSRRHRSSGDHHAILV